MPEDKSFGKLIRRAIEQLEWTQDELASEVGVSRGTVNRWLQDVQRPAVHYLKKLIDTLKLDEAEAYTLYYAGGVAPPVRHNLPLPNRFFTGREAYLQRIYQSLHEDGIVALYGLGGIGKTQIALAYARRFHPDLYPTALWVNAYDQATLETEFASLTETLQLPERNEQKQERRIKAVKQWLEEHINWLLVLDNVNELPTVEPYLLSKPGGHILLITRWQFPDMIAKTIAIEEMESEEGLRFLLLRSDILKDKTKLDTIFSFVRATALHLVELLGGFPLALDQAGAYVKETSISLAEYIELYEKERRYLLNRRGSPNLTHGHPESVTATIMISVRKACAQHPKALEVLYFCSLLFHFFPPFSMNEEVLYQDDGLNLDAKTFNDVVAILRGYSLVNRNIQRKMLTMHYVVRDVLIYSSQPQAQLYFAARVMFARQITIANELLDQAYLYETSDRDERVVGQYRQNLELYEAIYGATHRRTQAIKKNYANFLRSIGRDAEAAALEANYEQS